MPPVAGEGWGGDAAAAGLARARCRALWWSAQQRSRAHPVLADYLTYHGGLCSRLSVSLCPLRSIHCFPRGAALLQYPVFSLSAPAAISFGGAAFTVGHEIGHAYDSARWRLDARGQERNWWSPASLAVFVNKTECLANVYSTMPAPAYVPAGAALDARRTARESQADQYGLAAAWEAFSARVAAGATGPPNARLDARFTPAQLFFASVAQKWCEVARPEAQREDLAEALHPPGWARVRGPLSQFAPFAAAFNCSAGTPFNPPSRCSLW